ncbi:bacterial-like globin [Nitzschia inconspicua]|uniref:Bacterial-like globin n=1 Tax=Nitzschia inconspicua TaxID=303405 RepID=A0A9K3KT12_9STRA|nr:bacterial-like globin [Nitzschia inconspicua]
MVGSMMLPREERLAHFYWSSSNRQQPCFCLVDKDMVDLDVIKLHISPELIAAIFGVRQPESIRIYDKDSGTMLALPDKDQTAHAWSWPVEPKHDYEVRTDVVDERDIENEEPVVPIHRIFPLFPGDTDDAKSERIEQLSENFYSKLWSDPDTPAGLRDLFFSRTSSYKIQAFRQYDWFHETFGGPSIMENCEREKHLWPKVMAKHTSSRMSREHAISWLNIMNRALEEEFPDEWKLRSALALYWLHFYAFFPYSDEDRREFRRVVMKPLETMPQ